MMIQKRLNKYLSLPYTIEFRREEPDDPAHGAWFARVIELPGCITEADSLEEAAAMIQDAMAAWLEVALEDGREIPEPHRTDDYSGKFVVRLPKSLHRALVEAAERDGVSLNQWVNVVLSHAVGAAKGDRKRSSA
jgi:antitoxin HicB